MHKLAQQRTLLSVRRYVRRSPHSSPSSRPGFPAALARRAARKSTPAHRAADRDPATVPRQNRRPGPPRPRSEEHTSELQSLRHLVCRLLLEKKKKKKHEYKNENKR